MCVCVRVSVRLGMRDTLEVRHGHVGPKERAGISAFPPALVRLCGGLDVVQAEAGGRVRRCGGVRARLRLPRLVHLLLELLLLLGGRVRTFLLLCLALPPLLGHGDDLEAPNFLKVTVPYVYLRVIGAVLAV